MTPQEIINYYEILYAAASGFRQQKLEMAKYIQPRRYHDLAASGMRGSIGGQGITPDFSIHADILDPIGLECNLQAAAGMMSWTTPVMSDWLQAAVPDGVKETDELKTYLGKLSETANKLIRSSNFHGAMFELNLDLNFGSVCLYREFLKDEKRFHFRAEPDFLAAMGARGNVDTKMVRKFYSHQVAVKEFGEENVPEHVRQFAKNPLTWGNAEEYIHFVMPNPKRDPKSPLDMHKPWFCAWVHRNTQEVVTIAQDGEKKKTAPKGTGIIDGGAMDSPYLIGRFLPYSVAGINPLAPYGWSPCMAALPHLRAIDHLARAIDGTIELMYAPPVGVPESMKGKFHFRPYDTFRLGSDGKMPEPLALTTPQALEFAMMRYDKIESKIRTAFLLDIFQMFAELDPAKMTAAEVHARLGEKEDRIPIFGLLLFEFLYDLGQWIFIEMFMNGMWPQPIPRALLAAPGAPWTPKVKFNNKLVQLIDATQGMSGLSAVADCAQLAANIGDPALLDEFDIAQIFRTYYRSKGAPQEGLRDKWQVKQAQFKRAQTQQQNVQMQMQMEQAKRMPMMNGAQSMMAGQG